ncbi:RNA polymerase sigma factor [Pleomorphovibrio marinus]|uniref:RNA polymerase sigma factor n=1 Tax=Pleomorphovibrio marinus TaxID=2164132 RepID=UPI000E0A80FC|nr:sigma-70 family RNA polymerase sigma factor [Pleomorphovibrio marinus]
MMSFFEAHIWPLRQKLYRLAYGWTKNKAASQDAVQEVLTKAWERRRSLQEMDNPTGWVVKCLKTESLRHFRHMRKMQLGEIADSIALPQEEGEDHSKSIKQVLAFMEKLPEKQKEVFQLREIEGLTYDEIAHFMDIPLEQVKVNLHRARIKLKAHLINYRHAT